MSTGITDFHSNSSNNVDTVTFDVGDHIHKVSRALLERYPHTMLARLVDQNTWQQTGDDDVPLFIDRDGNRFGFVLDLMRDHEVHLPITVSKEALRADCEYFGLDLNAEEEYDDDHDDTALGDNTNDRNKTRGGARKSRLKIHQGDDFAGSLQVLCAIMGNADDDAKTLDSEIEKLKEEIVIRANKKDAIKASMLLFNRSLNNTDWECNTMSDRKTRNSRHVLKIGRKTFRFHADAFGTTRYSEFSQIENAIKVQDFFEARLKAFGLTLAGFDINGIFDKRVYLITLERKLD